MLLADVAYEKVTVSLWLTGGCTGVHRLFSSEGLSSQPDISETSLVGSLADRIRHPLSYDLNPGAAAAETARRPMDSSAAAGASRGPFAPSTPPPPPVDPSVCRWNSTRSEFGSLADDHLLTSPGFVSFPMSSQSVDETQETDDHLRTRLPALPPYPGAVGSVPLTLPPPPPPPSLLPFAQTTAAFDFGAGSGFGHVMRSASDADDSSSNCEMQEPLYPLISSPLDPRLPPYHPSAPPPPSPSLSFDFSRSYGGQGPGIDDDASFAGMTEDGKEGPDDAGSVWRPY